MLRVRLHVSHKEKDCESTINIAYARHRVESARLTYLGLVNHENDYIYSPWYVIIMAYSKFQ